MHVGKNILKRAFLYRISLLRLRKMGIKRVFSYTLGMEAGVSSEQVRKDFSEFRIRGSHRGGYDVDSIIDTLERMFSRAEGLNIVMVGMGNIGQALANYNWINQRNINIVAAFDIDPVKQRKRSDTAVYPVERMQEIIDRFQVKVAILAVPEISAQEVCNRLIDYGIRGIVNFAPVILKVPQGVVVNNVNLYDEVESVFYWIGNPGDHPVAMKSPDG